MKGRLQGFVVGVIVGAMVVPGIAMAATAMNISVVPNTIKVIVNGKQLTADNFLYKGTTYAPVRAISESLGKTVGFENGVATITDSVAMATSATVSPDPSLASYPVASPTASTKAQVRAELIVWVKNLSRCVIGDGTISANVDDEASAATWKAEFERRYNLLSAAERADDSLLVDVATLCVTYANKAVARHISSRQILS